MLDQGEWQAPVNTKKLNMTFFSCTWPHLWLLEIILKWVPAPVCHSGGTKDTAQKGVCSLRPKNPMTVTQFEISARLQF